MSDENIDLNNSFSSLNKNSFLVPAVDDSSYRNDEILAELNEISGLCRLPNFFTTYSTTKIFSNDQSSEVAYTVGNAGYYLIQVETKNAEVDMYIYSSDSTLHRYHVQTSFGADTNMTVFTMYLPSGYSLHFHKDDGSSNGAGIFDSDDRIYVTYLPFL